MKDIVISKRKNGTYDLVCGDEKKNGVDYSDMIKCVRFWTTMPKKLPKKSKKDKEPKDGDFLVFTLRDGGVFYLIYYEVDSLGYIQFYFCVDKKNGTCKTYQSGWNLSKREYVRDIRPMTDDEIEWFVKGMCRLGYTWDDKNKKIIDHNKDVCFPHEGEECFYVTEDGDIESKPFHYYDKMMRDLASAGNCFVERRKAEKFLKEMLEKEK